jgi:hypothetical protein
LAGADPVDAARRVGYSNPKLTARALVAHPQVRKALRAGAEILLLSEVTPQALQVMKRVLQDENPRSLGHRAKLAIAVYDRATRDKAGPDPAVDALAQLTTQQLAELVARGMAADAQAAQTIDVTPRETPPGDRGEA